MLMFQSSYSKQRFQFMSNGVAFTVGPLGRFSHHLCKSLWIEMRSLNHHLEMAAALVVTHCRTSHFFQFWLYLFCFNFIPLIGEETQLLYLRRESPRPGLFWKRSSSNNLEPTILNLNILLLGSVGIGSSFVCLRWVWITSCFSSAKRLLAPEARFKGCSFSNLWILLTSWLFILVDISSASIGMMFVIGSMILFGSWRSWANDVINDVIKAIMRKSVNILLLVTFFDNSLFNMLFVAKVIVYDYTWRKIL